MQKRMAEKRDGRKGSDERAWTTDSRETMRRMIKKMKLREFEMGVSVPTLWGETHLKFQIPPKLCRQDPMVAPHYCPKFFAGSLEELDDHSYGLANLESDML